MDSDKRSQGTAQRRGFSLYGFLVVLVVIVIGVVAVAVAAQRRGTQWGGSSGSSSVRGALPHCVLPGDVATVEGRVNVYSAAGGFPCYSTDTAGPMEATAVERMMEGEAVAIGARCGSGPISYGFDGTYRCGRKKEGFEIAEDRPFPEAARPVPWGGAARHLQALLPLAPGCAGGGIPVLVAGYIDAYLSPAARQPCGHMPIESPIPLTLRNLSWIEDALSISCGHNVRAGWFVADTKVACPTGLTAKPIGSLAGPDLTTTFPTNSANNANNANKEGFFCWGEESARENYRGGRKGRHPTCARPEGFSGGCGGCGVMGGGAEGFCAGCVGGGVAEGFCTYGQCFSPDEPGACAGMSERSKKYKEAARIELEGIRVADGIV